MTKKIALYLILAFVVGLSIQGGDPLVIIILKMAVVFAILCIAASIYRDGAKSA